MTYKKLKDYFLLRLLMGCLVLFFTSCSYKRTIMIKLDPSFHKQNIQVDLIGVNKQTLAILNDMSYEQYWDDYDKRGVNKDEIELRFCGYDETLIKTVETNNNIWQIWDGDTITYIFIAVDAPFMEQKLVWKVFLPLTSYTFYNFWSNRKVYININKNGLKLKE